MSRLMILSDALTPISVYKIFLCWTMLIMILSRKNHQAERRAKRRVKRSEEIEEKNQKLVLIFETCLPFGSKMDTRSIMAKHRSCAFGFSSTPYYFSDFPQASLWSYQSAMEVARNAFPKLIRRHKWKVCTA